MVDRSCFIAQYIDLKTAPNAPHFPHYLTNLFGAVNHPSDGMQGVTHSCMVQVGTWLQHAWQTTVSTL